MAATLPLVGCLSTSAPPQTAVGMALDVDVTSRAARLGSFTLAGDMMNRIEITADSIAALSSDAVVRRRTLEWKAYAIPAIQGAMFHPDPYVSYLDGWAFLQQMRRYFEQGGGRGLFGDHQALAIEATARVDSVVNQSLIEAVGEETADRLRGVTSEWAESHPLDNTLYLRPSMSQEAAEALAATGPGGLSALGSMQDMVRDAQQTAIILAGYLPKAVLWQSELMASRLADSSNVAPVLRAVDDMELTSTATRLLDDLPELVAGERAALMGAIAAERAALMVDVSRMSSATVEALFELARAERAVILSEMADMIATERAAALVGADSLTVHAFTEARAVVDHIFLRLLQAGALLAVLLALLSVLIWRALEGRAAERTGAT